MVKTLFIEGKSAREALNKEAGTSVGNGLELEGGTADRNLSPGKGFLV